VVGGIAFIAPVIGLTWYAFRRGRKIGQQEVANSSNYRASEVDAIKAAEIPGGNLGANLSPQEKIEQEEAVLTEPSEPSGRLRYLDEPRFGTVYSITEVGDPAIVGSLTSVYHCCIIYQATGCLLWLMSWGVNSEVSDRIVI
jgi:hypothetical protein